MKLKFPKTIKIGDRVWKIKTDKKYEGGSFAYKTNEIKIGTADLETSPLIVLSVIIHELKEILQTEQCVRYTIPSTNDNYLFNYNHQQHTDFCYRLSGLLNEFIR